MGRVAKALRVTWGATSLLVVESIVFGLSAMPGLATFNVILHAFGGFVGGFFEAALIGVAFVPAYLVFCVALMLFTATATKLMAWRAIPGDYRVPDMEWGMIRWAQYNAAIHLVRLFAGGVLRATPLWTWFLRLNGATIGRNVHVNTLTIYDHNLLDLGDDVVVGSDSKVIAHVGERGRLVVRPVRFGRGVTIGTNTVVFPGVVVGDGTAVGALSLVLKDTYLEPGCVYAGVPVRRIRDDSRPGAARDEAAAPVQPIA